MADLALPLDIMRLVVAVNPDIFFYVSHMTRELAAAAVTADASTTILGNIFYRDVLICVREGEHSKRYHDIAATNHYDFNTSPWTPCKCCTGAPRKVFKWLSRPFGGAPDLNMNVLQVLIGIAAKGRRQLPDWS